MNKKNVLDIDAIRNDFPVLKRQVHGKQLTYLDSAATTLKPQCVLDAISLHDTIRTANIHRGVHLMAEEATAQYEASREKVRKFIGARLTSEIVFTSGTTHGINIIAQSWGRRFIQSGDEILITHMEHHSNIVPWQMLCNEKGAVLKVAPMNREGELVWEEFEKLLSSKTKLVSVVHTSNALGTVNPIEKIVAAAHERGIPVLIDAAQAMAHTAINVAALDCDFMVFSGHKLFGPTGTGVLYGRHDRLESVPPFFGGGDMIRSVTFEKTTYAPLPMRLEAGTPNITGVVGLGAAIDYIMGHGLEKIAQYESELLRYANQALSKVAGLNFVGTAKNKASVISFTMKDIHPHDLGSLLDNEGVAVRTGHHCAQPVMDYYRIPATARASLAIYNTHQDIDALVFALERAKEIFS